MEAAGEIDQVLSPQEPHPLDLLGLARAAGLPLDVERLVLDMVPADADAESQPAAAQDVDLGRLLGDHAGLALRQDQHAAAQLDLLGDGGDEGHRREGLVKGIVLAVGRLPVAARGRAKDVIGDLDAVVAEILGGLRPIADLRRVGADVAGGEEGIQQHRRLLTRCPILDRIDRHWQKVDACIEPGCHGAVPCRTLSAKRTSSTSAVC